MRRLCRKASFSGRLGQCVSHRPKDKACYCWTYRRPDVCQPGQLPRPDRIAQSSAVCIVMIVHETMVVRHGSHVEAQSSCHSDVNNGPGRFVSSVNHDHSGNVHSRRSGANAGTKANRIADITASTFDISHFRRQFYTR